MEGDNLLHHCDNFQYNTVRRGTRPIEYCGLLDGRSEYLIHATYPVCNYDTRDKFCRWERPLNVLQLDYLEAHFRASRLCRNRDEHSYLDRGRPGLHHLHDLCGGKRDSDAQCGNSSRKQWVTRTLNCSKYI